MSESSPEQTQRFIEILDNSLEMDNSVEGAIVRAEAREAAIKEVLETFIADKPEGYELADEAAEELAFAVDYIYGAGSGEFDKTDIVRHIKDRLDYRKADDRRWRPAEEQLDSVADFVVLASHLSNNDRDIAYGPNRTVGRPHEVADAPTAGYNKYGVLIV